MFSRSNLLVKQRSSTPWLCREYYPRPNADHLRIDTPLLRLSSDEEELYNRGRFSRRERGMLEHTVQVWLDHEDEDKRSYDLDRILCYICEARVEWGLEVNATERVGLMFSFDDVITAFMFMTYFGGAHS